MARKPSKNIKKVEPLSKAKKAATKKKTKTAKSATPKKAVKKKPVNAAKKAVNAVKKTAKKKKAAIKRRATTFVRISENANQSTFVEMGKKVQAGEFIWAYYAIDGNTAYHYYRKK